MKLRSLGLIAMLVTSPAYADEAMTVAQDVASKWQTAYNNGDAGKIADLYVQDAVFSRLLKKSVGDASSPIRHLLPLRNPLI